MLTCTTLASHLLARCHTQGELGGGSGPLTVFAPTDAVLGGIYQAERVFGDVPGAKALLRFHVVPGRRLFLANLANANASSSSDDDYCPGVSGLPSLLQGQALATQVLSAKQAFVSAADQAFSGELVRPDLHCTNGVLHVVDGFLTFPGYRRPK